MDILFDDSAIMIVNKPAGLLTHQTKISSDRDSLVDRLREQFSNPPSPVHRLDRPTSGIILCAYPGDTARILGDFFVNGKVRKRYVAIVRGFTEQEGKIDVPLSKDGTGELQRAVTTYKTLKTLEIEVSNNKYGTSRYSLIQAYPETGRFHQIRRHLAGIGHPVLGDTSHGDLRHNRIFSNYFSNNRLLLHSDSLNLPHPVTGIPISISAPSDGIMKEIMEQFN
jgi:tRNA pseudouridine65 synthase